MEGMPLFRRALEQFTVEQLIFLMNNLINKHFFFFILKIAYKRGQFTMLFCFIDLL